ncbi:MAG: SH3 domain-containing protein, partial [Chloroflexus aggregans]
MPAKIDPRDWERLFNRRRRRGPLSILLRALVGGLLVLGLIGVAPLIMNQIKLARVTTAQTQIALQTREARATIQQAATQSAI